MAEVTQITTSFNFTKNDFSKINRVKAQKFGL